MIIVLISWQGSGALCLNQNIQDILEVIMKCIQLKVSLPLSVIHLCPKWRKTSVPSSVLAWRL